MLHPARRRAATHPLRDLRGTTLPPTLASFQLYTMAIPRLRPPDEIDQPDAVKPVGDAVVARIAASPRVPVHKEAPNKQIQLDRMKRRATGLLVGATVLFIVSLLLERQF